MIYLAAVVLHRGQTYEWLVALSLRESGLEVEKAEGDEEAKDFEDEGYILEFG